MAEPLSLDLRKRQTGFPDRDRVAPPTRLRAASGRQSDPAWWHARSFSMQSGKWVNLMRRSTQAALVIASDGMKIGTVDHLDGNQIKLTKSASPDGMHHFIPLADIDHVDAHVHLNKSASEARAIW